MRTIEFRGKRIDNGEWVYGNLVDGDCIVGSVVEWNEEYFCTEFWCKVDPSTVGQYIGKIDEGGTEIYEGDHLEAEGNFKDGSREYVGTVEWDKEDERFEVVSFHGRFEYVPDGCYVKGSVHDNPELMEVAEQ